MSIYATWLSITDDDHTERCARWTQVPKDDPAARMYTNDGREFAYDKTAACTCDNKGPIIYQGSHVNPDDGDTRGGYVYVCAIPNHCHPSVREQYTDDGPPVEFLRLSVGEDARTYSHEAKGGDATVVLTRLDVERLHDTLGQWLKSRERF